MHINDINALTFKIGLDKEFSGKRVIVILPKDGKKFYIARRGGTTLNKDEAFIYDYDRDGVATQCQQVLLQMGVKPEVVEAA